MTRKRAGNPNNQGKPQIPANLLCVPGFIDEVMTYTLRTAPYPERTLAFAGALALQATLASRKVQDEMGNRTNLYVLALANSGSGKEHPRKTNRRVLYESGQSDCLGNSFASGEGIEDRLRAHPVALFQVDELDSLLRKVMQSSDGRSELIISVLLQMYSSADGPYIARAKAGQPRFEIDQPCLSLFGTAIPKYFYESITPRLMTNGFLSRMLVLESGNRGRCQSPKAMPLPNSVLESARWWGDFNPVQATRLAPCVIKATSQARTVFVELAREADRNYSRCEEGNDEVGMAIWSRAREKACRCGLIYACSADRRKPVIDEAAASWACEFVRYQTLLMLSMVARHASESEFDRKCKHVLNALAHWAANNPETWMHFWKLSRKLPWPRREQDDVLETLVRQRRIDRCREDTGGRPGERLRLASGSCAPGRTAVPA